MPTEATTSEYFLEIMVRQKKVDPAGVCKESSILLERTCQINKDQFTEIVKGIVKAGIK
jgi:hypothetical protein